MKKTSFAKVVKDEIVSSDLQTEAKKKAFLSAYIKINGSVIFRNKKTALLLKFTDAKVAKFLYSLLQRPGQRTIMYMMINALLFLFHGSCKLIIQHG